MDAELEPLERCQGEPTANIALIRGIASCQRDLWLEAAGAYELGNGAEPCIHLSALDARNGILRHPGPGAELRLRETRSGAGQIDEITTLDA